MKRSRRSKRCAALSRTYPLHGLGPTCRSGTPPISNITSKVFAAPAWTSGSAPLLTDDLQAVVQAVRRSAARDRDRVDREHHGEDKQKQYSQQKDLHRPLI